MPTENRSSNNESVRLPRGLVDLALAHLPNDSAAKWEIYELLGQPAQQGQGEPVGWQFYQQGKWWNGDDRIKEHRKNTEDAGIPSRDVFAYPLQGQGELVAWDVAARIAAVPGVHEALELFSQDPTGDAGTSLVREVLDASRADPAEVEQLQGSLAIPEECPHLIVFDDTEVGSLMFSGSGARAAALKKWEAISTSWNANLFVRVARNSRDDRAPCATVADPGEVERLRAALKFYADRDHFAEDIGSDWDSVSGEPASILWHEDEAWFVEDGSIARAALERRSS